MPFALTGALVGAIVATRFSVLALIPTMVVVLAIAAVASLWGKGATIGALMALLVGLQLGYMAAAGAYLTAEALLRGAAHLVITRTTDST